MFLRTRVGGVRQIVVPAYTVTVAAAVTGLILGSLAAWYETAVLLGAPPPVRMLIGIGYGAIFLAFAVATAALVASLVRGVVATAGITLAVLAGLAIAGNLTGPGHWLPTTLAGAMADLVRGAEPTRYLPAAATAVVAGAAALAGSVVIGTRREL